MDTFLIFMRIFGGLGLFLLGMMQLSDGMKRVAGARMRRIIEVFTNNPVAGVLTGTAVTSIIQSSSASTVMTVGFVNAGVMTLNQAIGVIMGANIGTTMTAQLIAFQVDKYALFAIGLGSLGYLFVGKRRIKDWSQVLLGFGILFYGMSTMKYGLEPLKDSELVRQFFLRFHANPFLGLLAGVSLTCIVQSSSATIGMLQALVVTGLIDFQGAVPILLGDNIGTTITAQIAALGTNTNARRVAMAHTVFNILGSLIVMCVLPYFVKFVYTVTYHLTGNPFEFIDAQGLHPYASRYIANAHTFFNLTATICFLPFVKQLAWLVSKIIPGKGIKRMRLSHLDKRMEVTPSIALNQARLELTHMSEIIHEMYKGLDGIFRGIDQHSIDKIEELEKETNALNKELLPFLLELNQQPLDTKEFKLIPPMVHAVKDLERIGDHVINLTELAIRMNEENVSMNKEAIDDLETMYSLVGNMMSLSDAMFKSPENKHALRIIEIEGKVDSSEDAMREKYLKGTSPKDCHPASDSFLTEGIMNLERIGDHLKNIAVAMQQLI